jgi:iron complex outermembrane recepter protein
MKYNGIYMRSIFFGIVLIIIFLTVPLFAQRLPDETVIVTSNAEPVPFENLSRTVTVLTREAIANLPARSIAEALMQATSADIRSRAPFGLQADFSLRGATFSQALVLVNGMRINDSQTAHHNSDIPVQLQDVDRIEILHGPGSSIYGADAFGGIINIITNVTNGHAKPARGSFTMGEHGLIDSTFSMGFQKGKYEQTLSASANRSSGFMYDRDFRSVSASSDINFGKSLGLFVSHLNKEFGANGFYGPAPSKEWTNQTLVSLDYRGKKADLQGYYRTHGDRFLYDIRTPGLFESNHRTHSTGISLKMRFELFRDASIVLGGEAGGDWISSQNLGDHAFARTSVFGELQWILGKSAALYSGLRFDRYSNFGSALDPSISASWWALPRLRLRAALGRAFRIPSFTELYYHDPNNAASSSLKPESSWSAETGADIFPAKNWTGSLTLFARQEKNVIDWIRESTRVKWQTSNIRKLRAVGAELSLERTLNSRLRLAARYSRISENAGQVHYYSKYALDYARDSWATTASFRAPLALDYHSTINFKRRSNGSSYWVLDGRLERRFYRLNAALEYTNLLNRSYQEISGVDMPGRWFCFSLRVQ